MPFDRYFEELESGARYRHWPGRTIADMDAMLFCMLTMNHNPLHIDANYAQHSQHGRRLVDGLPVLSTAVGMSVAAVSCKCIANLDYEEIRHLAPVFHGETIYAETVVLEKKESKSKPDRGVVPVETLVRNQCGETVLTFQRRVLIPKQGFAAEDRFFS